MSVGSGEIVLVCDELMEGFVRWDVSDTMLVLIFSIIGKESAILATLTFRVTILLAIVCMDSFNEWRELIKSVLELAGVRGLSANLLMDSRMDWSIELQAVIVFLGALVVLEF